MAHALVHTADHDDVWSACRQSEIPYRGQAEGEGDRYRRENHRADEQHEEDEEVEEDDDEWDDKVAWLTSLADDSPAVEGEEIDEDMDYDPGDLLGKVLALINQVRVFLFFS